MNKKNLELMYTQRLRKCYLRYKMTGLDKIHLLLQKKLLFVISKTMI